MIDCRCVKGERAVIYRDYYYKNGINKGKPTMVYAGVHILKNGEDFNNLSYMGSGSTWRKRLSKNGVNVKNHRNFVRKDIIKVYECGYVKQDLLKEEGVCIAQTKSLYGDVCVNRKKTDLKKYSKNDILKREIWAGIQKANPYLEDKEINIIYRRICSKVRSFGRYHNWAPIRSFEGNNEIAYNKTWGDVERLIYQHMLNKKGIMPVIKMAA